MNARRPSEHPPVGGKCCFVAYNGVQRIRPVVTDRKIICAGREAGNKCRLYKHFVVAAKNKKGR